MRKLKSASQLMADLNEDRKRPSSPARLKGWSEIAQFLGQPVAVAQRWAKSGMPVRREGRFVTALTNELSQYLGREAGLNVPVRIPTGDTDLSTELKRALSHTRAASVRNSKH